MEPNKAAVLLRLKEFKRIGRDNFLRRYANGHGAKSHVIAFKGDHYDLKAIWASAHKPRIKSKDCSTKEAKAGLSQLGFTCKTKKYEAVQNKVRRFEEGGRHYREAKFFTRNPKLVAKAKGHYGFRCSACSFDFKAFYGKLGARYIECYHLKPLASQGGRTSSGVEDVAVLCSNCHRMVHRQNPPVKIKELQRLICAASKRR